MTVEATDGGHCKDVRHVRVELVQHEIGFGKGWATGQFVAHTSCVNVPAYDGWVVECYTNSTGKKPRPGLRLLPELAEVLPVWLRRAARAADPDVDLVQVQHTSDTVWIPYATLTVPGARSFAKSVLLAVELAPPGAHG